MQKTDNALSKAEEAHKTGNYEQALPAYLAYLQQHPANERALVGAAEIHRIANDPAAVVDLYKRAVDHAPENLSLRADLIDTINADLRPEDAMAMAKDQFDQHPDFLRFKWQVAQGHMSLGNLETARQILWECHEAAPHELDPIFYLSELAEPDDLNRLDRSLDELWLHRANFDEGQMIILGYARGKVAEKVKRYEEAWVGYELGARARRKRTRFDEQGFVHHLDLHKRLFTQQTIAAATEQDQTIGSDIVFIISLPRSGSTLVEQILTSHSQVTGIGERPFCTKAFEHWYQQSAISPQALFQPEALSRAREEYLSQVYDTAGGKPRIIVDKSISNYLYIGFLRALLPGAKFVQLTRNPLDTAFSCFATVFYTGIEWSYDLEEIGRTVRRYQRLMRHWMKFWPESIKTFRYEDFTNDVEAMSRELLEFCGLEWEPECLEFYKTERAVMTSSVVQVRQPIYQSAKGRASHFDAHLGPLKSAMGRAENPDWFLK